MDLNRLDNETELQYLWRVGNLKEDDPSITWDDIADHMNQYFRTDESEYRTSSAYRKPYSSARKFYDEVIAPSQIDNFDFKRRELTKERMKVQTEKIELNKMLRETARDEMILDRIAEVIPQLPQFEPQIPRQIIHKDNVRGYLLVIADAHFGIEFKVQDLYGNTINEYSPEIFEKRMECLFNHVLSTIKKEHIEVLNVWELGDSIQGILRLNSQLLQLRYGVIESALLYAEYMAHWLDDLSCYVKVNYQMVRDSNHSQIRICNAQKNAFPDENMGIVINSFLKERLKNNPNIKIIDNPTGFNFSHIAGYSVLGIHGEVKDLSTAINEYARMYGTSIDYLIGGHMHHESVQDVGINSEVIGVRSIIGVDPYGASLRRTSSPGANLFVFEKNYGKIIDYNYKLDFLH